MALNFACNSLKIADAWLGRGHHTMSSGQTFAPQEMAPFKLQNSKSQTSTPQTRNSSRSSERAKIPTLGRLFRLFLQKVLSWGFFMDSDMHLVKEADHWSIKCLRK